MIKYLSGDFPANTMLSVTITSATITWGLGKDNSVTLDHAMQSLTVTSQDEKAVTFSCALLDGRKFEAQADPKTFEKLNRIYLVRAKQSSPTSIDTSSSTTCTKCGMAHSSKFCPNCGEAAAVPHVYDPITPSNQMDVDTTVKKKGGCLNPILIVLCILVIFGVVANLFGKDDTTAPVSISSSSSSVASIPSSIVPPSSAPEPSSIDIEAVKATVLAMDEEIFQYLLNSEVVCNTLQDGINLVSQGQGTLLELYDLSKQAKEIQSTIFSNLVMIRTDSNKDYVDACKDYVINGQLIADDLIKYIDKQEMKYLSEAKQCIENVDNYVMIAVAKRMEYLIAQGFTGDEAAAILSPEESSSGNS